ncbi:unnamed protein product [Staurois parvus]|uniref:Uncharacterized protein n=1 Tax=Staurois parvus TaxID=386267 RepID=A0ABN9FR48_9NEOB|nr:unnamed protein product [Staurois parvus]
MLKKYINNIKKNVKKKILATIYEEILFICKLLYEKLFFKHFWTFSFI